MPKETNARKTVHPANLLLGAVGLLGIGMMIGGWTNANSASPIVGIAVEDRGDRLFRIHADGTVMSLNLAAGRTGSQTTANWELFKSP